MYAAGKGAECEHWNYDAHDLIRYGFKAMHKPAMKLYSNENENGPHVSGLRA
jgi:hypothetical protein